MLQGDMLYPVSPRVCMLSGKGAEIWVCLRCDRRMLLRWLPDYEKLVLAQGDDTLFTSAGRAGCR